MIRDATFGDMPRLRDLFYRMHEESQYRDVVGVHDDSVRSIIMQSIQRNGNLNNGGTMFAVHENAGEIEGFMIGILDRFYHYGDRLRASDFFLYCTPEAQVRASSLMIDRYIEWAVANPKVFRITLSWTDAISGKESSIERAYERRGFRKCGAIWTREAG